MPHLGSFNRPEGPGFGNGAGGARGARVLIASAGFGNGYAAGPANDAQDGPVRSAGFANTQSLAQAAPHSKRQAVAAFQPVVITAKPDPIYTKEAQRLHIQGEVILRVIFKASGQLQILGVEHGLGHGLDEAAIRAAERIRFKPARRNGLAVDIPATLHILFQLAE
ncbi:MAG: energy transducer TonB [Terriglobia bacterium]